MKLKLFSFSLILFLLIFCFFLSQTAQAAQLLDVVINEITWMGTSVSYNDEWIELYNNTHSSINLEAWVLKSADDSPRINLTGTIAAKSFYLLERTDDNSVSNIPANQIYKGILRNNGENLRLYDNSGNLIDKIDCNSGWFGGDNKTKQTMERINPQAPGNNPENWQSSQNPGGTPKTKNSVGASLGSQKILEDSPLLSQQLEIKKNYPPGIVFNEILPSPEGSDSDEEWIEIFNQNSFEVGLSGWQIADTAGRITTYTLPFGTKIPSQGFLVLPRPETKITLNNDEDGLILTSPDGKIIDEVNYKKAPQSKSYNRVNSDWLWSNNLTPGADNIVEKAESKSPENKSASESVGKRELAAIGEQATNPSKFLSALLVALIIAISSGIVILILKKNLKENRPI